MKVFPKTKHIKELCAELGPNYDVRVIDFENVIYRNFGNGFDVKIKGMDTNSKKKRATLYLRNKRMIVKIIENVPQSDIGDVVEKLKCLSNQLNADASTIFEVYK